MKTISLTVDGKTITASEGEKLLWVALDNGVYIPNLCALREHTEPFAGCRLCFVEIAGKEQPVTACTEPVRDRMVVNTRGPRAQRLARAAFELIMSNHHIDCGHCPRNRTCELQKIAAHLRTPLRGRRLRRLGPDRSIDASSPTFTYDPNKCVLCGRCVWVCRERLGIGAIGFARRGFERMVTTFSGEPIAESRCEGCAACVEVCPVGALFFNPDALAKRGGGELVCTTATEDDSREPSPS